MAKQAAVTSADLKRERAKLADRLGAIGQEVAATSDLERLQALARERGTIEQAQRSLDERIAALKREEAEAAEAAQREANAAERERVEGEYLRTFAKLRELIEQAAPLAMTVLQLEARHAQLGGSSQVRYYVDPVWAKALRFLCDTWAKQNRRVEDAAAHHTAKLAARREHKLAELERQQQAEAAAAALAKRVADREARLWGVRADA